LKKLPAILATLPVDIPKMREEYLGINSAIPHAMKRTGKHYFQLLFHLNLQKVSPVLLLNDSEDELKFYQLIISSESTFHLLVPTYLQILDQIRSSEAVGVIYHKGDQLHKTSAATWLK